jgi:hypothetical protein
MHSRALHDVPSSLNIVIEAEMSAQAVKVILESGDFRKTADIASDTLGSSNPRLQFNRWKKAGLVFVIRHRGSDLYPIYALDLEGSVRPLPIMGQILRIFAGKDAWQKAFWFASVNSYLGNKTPKELLRSRPEEVLRAAQIEAAGVLHG